MTRFLIKTFSQASKLGAMIALVATNLSAEEISAEAKHWNKVDQLTVDCETAQSFGNDDQIKNAALELWQLTDIPFGLRASAESCVSEYLDGDESFHWVSAHDDDLVYAKHRMNEDGSAADPI